MTLPVIFYPAPGLRRLARIIPPDAFGTRLLTEQADQMVRACEELKGIGLAAQQVGFDLALAVIPLLDPYRDLDLEAVKRSLVCVANPEIIDMGPPVKGEEGCLSFGGVLPLSLVVAPAWVQLRATAIDGAPIEERVDGYAARAVFHEVEHLAGRLLVDRVKPPWRKMFLKKAAEVVSYQHSAAGHQQHHVSMR
jgi:peptide deformylase